MKRSLLVLFTALLALISCHPRAQRVAPPAQSFGSQHINGWPVAPVVVAVDAGAGAGGGGAGAPAWDPSSLSNVWAWYRSDNVANDTTGGVYVQLQDKSAKNNHMTAAAAGNRPVAGTSALIAGKATIQCNKSATQWLRKTGTSVGGTSNPFSFCAEYRQVSWTSGGVMAAYGASNRPQIRQSGVTNQVDVLAVGAPLSTTVGNTQDGSTNKGGFGDGLWRVVCGSWDGANQFVYRENLETRAIIQEDTDVNAGAATADGGTLSLCASVAGVLPIDAEFTELFWWRAAITAQNLLDIETYLRTQWVGYPTTNPTSTAKEIFPTGDSITEGTDFNVSSYRRFLWQDLTASNDVFFCGTRTSRNYDQPTGYPEGHNGLTGDTIVDIQTRVVGFWGGGGCFTLGCADDPGAGNRGGFETLAGRADGQGGGHQNGGALVLLHAGTNDSSSGAISTTAYSLLVKRMYNVHTRIKRFYLAQLISRTDNAPAQTRIDTFNAALPALCTTLAGAGFPCTVVDMSPTGGFNTGTMLNADGLHPNPTGGQFMSTQWKAAMVADGNML